MFLQFSYIFIVTFLKQHLFYLLVRIKLELVCGVMN